MSILIRKLSRGTWRGLAVTVATVGLIAAPFTTATTHAYDYIVDMDEVPLATADAYAYDIAMYPQGDMWVTERDANQIARIAQDGSTVAEYEIPTEGAAPTSIALGPDEAMWFVESGVHKIGRISLAGTITEYELDESAEPVQITSGNDGNLWFTDATNNQVSKMTTSGVVTDYAVPTSNAGVFGIGLDSASGRIWFTERNSSKVAFISAEGDIYEYALPNSEAMPTEVIVDYTGKTWFTQYGSATIGNMTVEDDFSAISNYEEVILSDSSSRPYSLTVGQDRSLWYTDLAPGQHKVGRVDLENVNTVYQEVWEYELPSTTANPLGVAVRTDDGSVWYTQAGEDTLGTSRWFDVGFLAPREYTVTVGEAFEQTLLSSGNPVPQYVLSAGELPAGLTLTDNGDGTGMLAGTPEEGAEGAYEFEITLLTPMEHDNFPIVMTVLANE